MKSIGIECRILFTEVLAAIALLLLATAYPALAQSSNGWARAPGITVVANGDDARIAFVAEAVAYWNAKFERLGSGFRLGNITVVDRPMPERELLERSNAILDSRSPDRLAIPGSLLAVPGDIVVFLAHTEFVSFVGGSTPDGRRIVGIRGDTFAPLNMPNVARNVIAHELGHVLGLGHNVDPAMLMCGRPAPCRPRLFSASEPRMFPLSPDEERELLALYPPRWPAR